MHAGLRARPGTDCATRTRIVYRAERPLTEDDGGWLPEATRTLSPFSSFVAGAKDHLRLTLGSELEASFAVGGDELVVAYGKLGTKVPMGLVRVVEARLAAWFGPIHDHRASREPRE